MQNILSPQPFMQTFGLTLVRCLMGIFLIYHGAELFNESIVNKYLSWDLFKFNGSRILVYTGKLMELTAGILFFLGLFTRIAAILTIGVMGFITFFIGKGIIWYDDQHPFLFILLAIVFFVTGPGPVSIDKKIFDKNK